MSLHIFLPATPALPLCAVFAAHFLCVSSVTDNLHLCTSLACSPAFCPHAHAYLPEKERRGGEEERKALLPGFMLPYLPPSLPLPTTYTPVWEGICTLEGERAFPRCPTHTCPVCLYAPCLFSFWMERRPSSSSPRL